MKLYENNNNKWFSFWRKINISFFLGSFSYRIFNIQKEYYMELYCENNHNKCFFFLVEVNISYKYYIILYTENNNNRILHRE